MVVAVGFWLASDKVIGRVDVHAFGTGVPGTFALVDSIGGPRRLLATGIKPGLLSVVYTSSVGVETGLLIVEH